MKNWKKSWKASLDKIIPPLDENIKNTQIPKSAEINANGKTLALSKKVTISVAIVLVVAIITGIALACTLPFMKKAAGETFVFSVEINPAITVVTDENGTVKSAVASNSDADVILANESASSLIIGKPLGEAISNYADLAGKLGYLKITDSAVRISACERGENLLQSAKDALQNHFIEKGVLSVVLTETVNFDEFSSRSGFIAQSLDSLSSIVLNSDALYNDREAENADEDILKKLYIDNILSSTILNEVKDYIYENLAIISQFESILGVSANRIEELLNEFSEEILLRYSTLFSTIMGLIDSSESPIASLLSVPKTFEEFADTLSTALKIEFDARLDEFEGFYEEIRTVTQEEYDSFLQNVLQEYGSYENYWQAIK